MDTKDVLWIHKYKPKNIDDLKLPEEYRNDFQYFIDSGIIPHLLLYGPPGGGKTTLANILCSKNGIINNREDNVLEIDGSSKRHRGISSVEELIEPFLKYPPSEEDNIKIVFVEEADKLTPDAFTSLRVPINNYSEYGRFIFTCNDVSKIPDAIISRFEQGLYHFEQMPMEYIKEYCESILKNENISYNSEDVDKVINRLYPDLRRMISRLQRYSYSGKLYVKEDDLKEKESQLVENVIDAINTIINNGNKKEIGKRIKNISDIVEDPFIDYGTVYSNLFYSSKIKNVGVKVKVNEYANSHKNCVSPSMHFMSMVFSLMEVVKEYYGKS